MANLGIIVAEDEEFFAIENIVKNISIKIIYDLEFLTGVINKSNIILVKSGVGKVNASRTTQILIDKFDVDYVLNVGSAGGVNESFNIGDIIIGTKVVQHDFDVSAFGREKGMVPDVGRFFCSDEVLVNRLISFSDSSLVLRSGIVASGDRFITDINVKDFICNEFGADCIEMEGAAVAQVCFLCRKPFVIIKSISDKPNGSNNIDFDKFLRVASLNCAKIIDKLTK